MGARPRTHHRTNDGRVTRHWSHAPRERFPGIRIGRLLVGPPPSHVALGEGWLSLKLSVAVSTLSEPSLTNTLAVLLSHEVYTAKLVEHIWFVRRVLRKVLRRHGPRWLVVGPSWSSPSGRSGWPALACGRCRPGPWSGPTDPTMLLVAYGQSDLDLPILSRRWALGAHSLRSIKGCLSLTRARTHAHTHPHPHPSTLWFRLLSPPSRKHLPSARAGAEVATRTATLGRIDRDRDRDRYRDRNPTADLYAPQPRSVCARPTPSPMIVAVIRVNIRDPAIIRVIIRPILSAQSLHSRMTMAWNGARHSAQRGGPACRHVQIFSTTHCRQKRAWPHGRSSQSGARERHTAHASASLPSSAPAPLAPSQ